MRIFAALCLVFFIGTPAHAGEFKKTAAQDEATQQVEPIREPLAIVTQDGVTHPFRVEIARTREELMQGLMNRLEMPEDAGMLFIFARENPRSFWMKGTFIPLDMVFIRADGTIHHIHHNAVPHDQTGIPSEGPVLAVLEINGGVAEKLGLKPGNKVLYKTFGTAPLQVE